MYERVKTINDCYTYLEYKDNRRVSTNMNNIKICNILVKSYEIFNINMDNNVFLYFLNKSYFLFIYL